MIRPATPDDLPAFKRVIDATALFPSELLDDMAGGLADDDGDERWLAFDPGDGPSAVAHYVPERMTSGTWNLLLIAVHPDSQSRGIGARLMAHVEDALGARGERVLLVETSGTEAFERTRRFYRTIGYDEEARIRDYYDAGDDKVVFRKALRAAGGRDL